MIDLDGKEHQGRTVGTDSQIGSFVIMARGGNRNAFSKLTDLFWGDIFRMVYYRTFSRVDAEDLTQEIFMRAFAKLTKLKETEKFKPWLYSIAVNRVRDFLRKKRVMSIFEFSKDRDTSEEFEEKETHTPSPLEAVIRKRFWTEVRRFSESLSGMERQVFLLRFMDEFTLSEIAEVLGKDESSIKTHLYRAIEKFRRKPKLLRMLREGI